MTILHKGPFAEKWLHLFDRIIVLTHWGGIILAAAWFATTWTPFY